MENTSFIGTWTHKKVNHYVGFLHNGRARTIDEAILWHGGEAEESKSQYIALNRSQKNQLIAWLQQL